MNMFINKTWTKPKGCKPLFCSSFPRPYLCRLNRGSLGTTLANLFRQSWVACDIVGSQRRTWAFEASPPRNVNGFKLKENTININKSYRMEQWPESQHPKTISNPSFLGKNDILSNYILIDLIVDDSWWLQGSGFNMDPRWFSRGISSRLSQCVCCVRTMIRFRPRQKKAKKKSCFQPFNRIESGDSRSSEYPTALGHLQVGCCVFSEIPPTGRQAAPCGFSINIVDADTWRHPKRQFTPLYLVGLLNKGYNMLQLIWLTWISNWLADSITLHIHHLPQSFGSAAPLKDGGQQDPNDRHRRHDDQQSQGRLLVHDAIREVAAAGHGQVDGITWVQIRFFDVFF